MSRSIPAATAALFLVLFGCRGGSTGPKVHRLAFVAGAATDFWTFARRGCDKAVRELGDISVDFRFTSGGAAVEQRAILEDLITKGVEGLAVTPLDPVNQKPLIERIAATLPVVITDSDIPGGKRLCYVGTDNVEAGRVAAGLIKEALPRGGRIMMFVGKTDAQNAKERIEGIKEVLAGTAITIVDIRTDDIDRVRAKANVNDTLVRYPDIDCLVGLWSYNGPMIVDAVKDAGKLGKVPIVAFDEENETIAGVRDGYIYATVVQQPFEFGYRSMKLLASVIKGDPGAVPAEGRIIVPVRVIRRAEAAEFLERTKALREGRAE